MNSSPYLEYLLWGKVNTKNISRLQNQAATRIKPKVPLIFIIVQFSTCPSLGERWKLGVGVSLQILIHLIVDAYTWESWVSCWKPAIWSHFKHGSGSLASPQAWKVWHMTGEICVSNDTRCFQQMNCTLSSHGSQWAQLKDCSVDTFTEQLLRLC